MNQTRLLGLVIAAVIVLAGGWYFGTATKPPRLAAMHPGTLMFPELTAKLKDLARIEIVSKGKTTTIELKNGVWGAADRGGYRVQDSKLRAMLTALTELRLVEPRTADPEQYKRLGVEDPANEKEGTANLLRLLDGGGKPIVSVIAGHRRTRTQGHVPDQVYVRLPGDSQTWLAEGGLQADADPQVWLDRDVMNIAHGLIAKVTATRNGEAVELVRDGDKLKVTTPVTYPKLDDYKLDDVSRALEALSFQDVRSDKEPIGEKVGEAVFSTVEGMEVSVMLHQLDKDGWTRFTVHAPERGKPEAERLNAKLAGWAFQIGGWKDKSLVPTIAELKAAEPASASPVSSETAPPGTVPPGTTPADAIPAEAAPPDAATSDAAPSGMAPSGVAPSDAVLPGVAPGQSAPVDGSPPEPPKEETKP